MKWWVLPAAMMLCAVACAILAVSLHRREVAEIRWKSDQEIAQIEARGARRARIWGEWADRCAAAGGVPVEAAGSLVCVRRDSLVALDSKWYAPEVK